MRIFSKFMAAVIATGLAASVAGTAAAQQELKLNQVGAALAFPLFPASGDVTYISITNVGASDRNLHFNVIKDEGWQATDFDCPVTASETVLVVFTRIAPELYQLSMECNFGTGAPVFVSRVFSNWSEYRNGVLFVANETHECKDGSCTTNSNDLFGDWVRVNAGRGFAQSAGAIPFQGINPLADGVTDRDYKFDNDEYAMFPATLATNFIAPGINPFVGGLIGAELFLFTLDGRANIGSRASLDVVFFDDDETPTSAHLEFGCVTKRKLEDIDPNFAAQFLGSGAGHLYMTVLDTDQPSNVHDNKFGNGNAIRVVGVHGWLLQDIRLLAVPGPVGDEGASTAWARSLAQGMMPQDLDGDDVPTFDGL